MANLGDTGENQNRNEDAPAQDLDSDGEGDFVRLDNPLILGKILMQLTEDNFWIWSWRMREALGALRKFGFVDGTIREPDVGSKDHGLWKVVDAMVIFFILNNMSTDVASGFRYMIYASARDLWKKIEERYGQVDSFLVYRLHRDIRDLRQGEMNVNAYFCQFKTLWDHLYLFVKRKSVPDCTCAAGNSCSQWDGISEVMQFLIGLNQHFDGVRNRILAMEPLPCIHKVFNLVWTFEAMNEARMNSQLRPNASGWR